MDQEKSIDVLNILIKINNDRIEGYKIASEETKEIDLRTFFSHLMETSQKCKTELVTEVHKLGGTPIEGNRVTGKFFRVWMDIKAAISSKNRKAIFSLCKYGENIAVATYADAIKDDFEDLTSEQQDMIKVQYIYIKADYDKVKNLHNMSS